MPKRKKNQQKNFDTSNKLGESHALMQDPEAEEKKKKKGKQKEIFFNQTEVDFGSSEEGSSESEQGSEKEESRIQKKQSKTKINWKAVRGIIHTGKSVSELLSLIFKKAPEILQNDTDCIQLLSLFKGQEVFWLKAFKEPSNIDAVLKLDSEQFFMLLVIFDRLVEAKGNKATQYKKDFCKVLKDRLKFFKQQKVEGIREFVCQAAVQMRAHTSTVQNALKTYLSNTTIYNQIGTSKVKRHMGEVLTLALHKTDNQLTFDAAALQAVMKAMLGASQLTHYLAKDPLNLKRAFIFARIMRRTERFVSILGDLRSTVVNQAALEGWARVYQDIISNSKLWDTSIKEAHGVSKTVLLKALDISLTMASISNVVPGKKREKRFAESEELPKSLERSITPAKKQHVRSAKPLLAQQFRTKNFQKIFSIKNIKNVIDTNKFVGLLKPKRAALRLSKLVNVRKNLGEKTSKAEFNSIIFCLLKYQEEVFEYGSLIQLLEADLNNYSKISDAAYNVFESCQQAFNFLEKLKEQKIHIQIKDASSNVKIIALQVSQLQKARFGGALFLESSLSAARPALIHVSGASKVVDAFKH